MSKAVFTIEDKDGQIAVSIDYGDAGLDKNSPAHKVTAILSKWLNDLDCMPTEAPRMVIAAEDVTEQKAGQVAHLGSQRTIIHAHGFDAPQ